MNPILEKSLTRPGWLLQKAYLWGRSYVRLKPKDVIFAFYPKTGSTWVRIFFHNLLTLDRSAGEATFTFDDVNFAMPEFGNENFLHPWPFKNCPCIVKTHRPYAPVFHANHRVVLFVREPRDVMVSFLHYANAKKEIDFEGDLKDLVMHPEMGLRYYFTFVNSWRHRAKLIVKYEALRSEPEATFTQLVRYLGLNFSDEQIRTALERSSLDNTRKAQAQSSDAFQQKFKEGFVFARKGASGEGEAHFDDELNALYQSLKDEFQFDLYD